MVTYTENKIPHKIGLVTKTNFISKASHIDNKIHIIYKINN